jgi:ribosomal protein L30
MTDSTYIRIKLVRSPIGYKKYQRVTAEALGLRKMQATVIHRATPQIMGMVHQINHLLLVEPVDEAEGERAMEARRKKRALLEASWQRQPVAAASAVTGDSSTSAQTLQGSAAGDDLTRIEGIGPKMSAALVAQGIDTYQKLAAADETQLRSAIEAAGLKLAPGLGTWAEQGALAARGDWDGLEKLQKQLVGGRRKS